MYGIYTNIGGILMGSMLPYIPAPWIRHGIETSLKTPGGTKQLRVCGT